MSKLEVVSIKVPKEIKKLMKRTNVKWSEYLREVIENKIREELAKEASKKLDEIKSRAKPVPTEEIVKWIKEDRMRKSE